MLSFSLDTELSKRGVHQNDVQYYDYAVKNLKRSFTKFNEEVNFNFRNSNIPL